MTEVLTPVNVVRDTGTRTTYVSGTSTVVVEKNVLVKESKATTVPNGTNPTLTPESVQEAGVMETVQTVAAANTFTSGPDQLMPADNIISWHGDQPVKLRMEERGPLSEEPVSVSTLFQSTVKRVPNNVALASKRNGVWVTWTYAQYYEDVKRAAKAFIKLGLEPHHGVGIIGFNSPEWFISDLGAIFAGGFAVGIYTTNSPEACHYVADNCEANILVVENDQQLQKILKVQDRLPHLKAIIQYSGEPTVKQPNLYSWEEFIKLSESVSDDAVRERIQAQAPNKCCTLIYTSGTTGNPKGVMLSHDNITWTALMAGRQAQLRFGEEVLVSYLPLSHIAAQLVDIYLPICYGSTLYFAEPDALKGSLGNTLREARPTGFFGVPRVWEKMQDTIVSKGKQGSTLKKKIAAWAKDIGLRGNMSKMQGGSTPFGWGLANMFVFKKVKDLTGLDRCRFCLTGAAPIMRDTLDFFMSLDLPLMELYGMSESTGPHTISFPNNYWIGSVGTEFSQGASTKIENPDVDGNGEICMNGRHVFMGYLNMEEKTKETIDEEGWLRTGDVGRKDEKGFLYITGRIKELLITAGGENVAPVPLEDSVKEELPVVSNCMLIGDKKKFLSILLTLKTEVDLDTMEPSDKLTHAAQEWCQSLGSSATTLSDIVDKDELVLKAIQAGIDRANKKAPSRAQNIQKWSILPRDFSIPGGELGPTLKLKRPVVHQMYIDTINSLYGE